MRQPGSALFLARYRREPAGFAHVTASRLIVALGVTLIVEDLFVAPQARRQGVARALLRRAVTLARALASEELHLETAVGNAPAQALYAACGWRREERFVKFLAPAAE